MKFIQRLQVFTIILIPLFLFTGKVEASTSEYFKMGGIGSPLSLQTPPPGDDDPVIDGQGDSNGESENQEEKSKSDPVQITNIQQNEYHFDTTSWISALLTTLSRDSARSADGYKYSLKLAAKNSLGLLIDLGTDGIAGIGNGLLVAPTQRIWKVSFGIALAVFPLVMVVNFFLVHSQGLGAGAARAEMIQTLVENMILVALAWGSYILVNYVLSIGWGFASFIMDLGIEGVAGNKYAAVEAIVTGIVAIASGGLGGIVFFYLTVFFLIFALMLLGALKLSYYALIVVAVMGIVLAPAVIILGGIPYFRWVYGLWMKVVSGVIILPIFNALMIRLWAIISPISGNGVGGKLLIVTVNLGLLSVLITINGKIAQFTFGPVFNAGKKALNATVALGKVLVSAAAVAASGGSAAPLMGKVIKNPPGGGDLGPGGAELTNGLSTESTNASVVNRQSNPGNSNQSGLSAYDAIYRPGKALRGAANVLRRARSGDLSPEQMNQLAMAGRLTDAMMRDDPLLRVLQTPMQHAIKTAERRYDIADHRAWSLAQNTSRDSAGPGSIPSNQQGITGFPSKNSVANSLLNYSDPDAANTNHPAGFEQYSNRAYDTLERINRAAAEKGVSTFDHLPAGISKEQFAAAAAYSLVPPEIYYTPQTQEMNPITAGIANQILTQVRETSQGGAKLVALALEQTTQEILEGNISLNTESLINRFSQHLAEIRTNQTGNGGKKSF